MLAIFLFHGIRISDPALGRPKALTNDEKKQAYADNTDREDLNFPLRFNLPGLYEK